MAKKRRKNKVKAAKRSEPVLVVSNGLPRLLLSRIEQRLAATGLSKWAAGQRAGLGETYMSDLFNGKNTKPSIQAMISISRVLECSVAYLLGETYDVNGGDVLSTVPRMPLVGTVETGTFRKLAQGEPVLVARPISTQHPEAKHFSLLVEDFAMSAAKLSLLPGMEALCIDIADAELPVESGKIYAIRRSRIIDGEQTYETILRRARVFQNKVELLAESNNGHFEPIVLHGKLTSDRTLPIYAFGLVYGAFQSSE